MFEPNWLRSHVFPGIEDIIFADRFDFCSPNICVTLFVDDVLDSDDNNISTLVFMYCALSLLLGNHREAVFLFPTHNHNLKNTLQRLERSPQNEYD